MSLADAFINEVLTSDKVAEYVDQRAKMQFDLLAREQRLTRKQLAELYQVCTDSIDNLESEELTRLGWKRIYLGSLPRFERIAITGTTYKQAKKG